MNDNHTNERPAWTGSRAWFAAVGAAALLAAGMAHGDTLHVVDDVFVNQNNPAANMNNFTWLVVRADGVGRDRRGLARFDLSVLPSTVTGANVAKATLRLWVQSVSTGGTVGVHRVTSGSDEQTVNWLTQPSIEPLPEGSTIIGTAASNSGNEYLTVDITALVRDWLDGVQANEGVALLGDPLDAPVAYFDAKHNEAESHALEIEVVLEAVGPPGPAGPAGPLNPNVQTGATNTAVGVGAFQNNTTGERNTTIGAGALFSNTTGNNNTASGSAALLRNTTGDNNTASGQSALFSNTTGFGNTAGGAGALFSSTAGNNNTANGSSALLNNTTGNDNTGSGQSALSNNTTGNDNTASGRSALLNNTTGSQNIAIGKDAGRNNVGGDLNIHIGNTGANESSTTRIGSVQTRAFIAGIRGMTTGVANAIPVVIDSSGQLGTVSSSARFKEDIHDMGGLSERLLALRPVVYRYRAEVQSGERPQQYGLIAEEVEQSFPELVAYGADGQVETVHYEVLGVLLLNEMKKQDAVVRAQQVRIANQDDRLAQQQQTLADQQQRFTAQAAERAAQLAAQQQALAAQEARIESQDDRLASQQQRFAALEADYAAQRAVLARLQQRLAQVEATTTQAAFERGALLAPVAWNTDGSTPVK